MKYTFPCGCSYDILEDRGPDEIPLLDFWVDDIPYNCPAVWELLGRGETKGIFQLESPLGRHWSKVLKPEHEEHLAALGSILRPGCLESLDENGISETEHYCKRKNKQEEITYYHPALEDILNKTYGGLIYQELALAISQKLAGFDLKAADALRKCVPGDTMFVSRQRGWVSINTLLQSHYNDDFLVMDECGRQHWKKIKRIWCTGKHVVHHVISASGFEIRMTRQHQILSDDGWKAYTRLKDDDSLITCKRVWYQGRDIYDVSLAMVIAGLVTEGYFPNKKGEEGHFTNFDVYMMELYRKHFHNVFGCFPSMGNNNRVARLNVQQKKFLLGKMKAGLSAVKQLPEQLMGATFETTRQFLSFMLAAEGGVCQNGTFGFSSKSYTLIHQVKALLLRFGIRTYIQSKHVNGYPDTYYNLSIDTLPDQKRLCRQLTCCWPTSKIKALYSIIKNKQQKCGFTTDIVPAKIVSRFVNQYPSSGRRESGTFYNANISKLRLLNAAYRMHDKQWKQLCKGNQVYETIKERKRGTRECKVYDFQMEDEDTPYIVANGFVIHNSMGKKLPAEMAKCKKAFLEGAKKTGILTDEQAEYIFDGIEKSQRYSFNKSHAMSYGLTGYDTAYIKAHFPNDFYTSWLYHSKEKPEPKQEVFELVNDAQKYSIRVDPPDLRRLNPNFEASNKVIYFGLTDIKNIGQKVFGKLLEVIKSYPKPLNEWTWFDFLKSNITAATATPLIKSGALRWLKMGRRQMLQQFNVWDSLTKKEQQFIVEGDFSNLIDGLKACGRPKKEGGGAFNSKRVSFIQSQIQILEKPPSSMQDTANELAAYEEELLGVPLTVNRIDDCDISNVNMTCGEFLKGRQQDFMTFGVEIKTIREIKTKRGKNPGQAMCYASITDGSGLLDAVCFPDQYIQYKNLLQPGATVIIQGTTTKRDPNQIVIQKMWRACQL